MPIALFGQGRGRGTAPPALFLLLLVALIRPTSAHRYATLGPEATGLLRVLFSDRRDVQIIRLEPGGLADALARSPIEALILPQDWADEPDLHTARRAGIAVITLQRHTSIANIVANIRSLGTATGTEPVAKLWIEGLESGQVRIRRGAGRYPPTRVLVLSPEGYTPGQGALITELIGIANGINVAAEAGIPEARQIGDDQIRTLAPDVVLLMGWTPEATIAFLSNPLYQGIAAFDRARIYQVTPPGKDPDRLVDDIQMLADLIHPVEF
jgi:ABC-type Fe3+-hydroxamate transport system substrate-binding protein